MQFLLTLAVLILSFTSLGQTTEELRPRVYCYSIGVSDNPGGSLASTTASAERFSLTVSNLFPGAIIKTFTSPSNPATPEAIEQLLREDIPSIPRYSSILFYFGGHGIRNLSSATYDEDLHLLLSGAKAIDYHRKSIRFTDLVDVLNRTKMVNGVVVLDSCFSGSAMDVNTRSGKIIRAEPLASPRFVYYFATGSDQRAFSGDFTSQFLRVWTDLSKRESCLSPDRIADEITRETLATPQDSGYRTRQLLPKGVSWCFSNYGKPSTLLVFIPNGYYKGSSVISFSDGVQQIVDFGSATDPFFLRLVPKDAELTISASSGRDHVTNTLSRNSLLSDVIVMEVDKKSLVALRSEDRMSGLRPVEVRRVAELVLNEVGASKRSADFLEFAGRNLARSGDFEASKHFFGESVRFADAAKAQILLAALNEAPGPSTVARLDSLEARVRYLSDYELLNGIGAASNGWSYLLNTVKGTTNEAFIKTRTYFASKAAGNVSEALRLQKEIVAGFGTNDFVKSTGFAFLSGLDPAQTRLAGNLLVETAKEWRATEGSLVRETINPFALMMPNTDFPSAYMVSPPAYVAPAAVLPKPVKPF